MQPAEALHFMKIKYDQTFLDAIPLTSTMGEAKGMAFILPYPVRINAKQTHRVYVKQMLLSEKVEKILPDWSFFVTSVLNVTQLRPTASREEFYDDPMLDMVRKELGDGIREYLIHLVHTNPTLLKQIIQIHYESIKSLAKEDNELYALFIDWLPFQTTLGIKKMKEIRSLSEQVLFTSSVDEYRQISQVAKSQSICVINGGYTHDAELIQRLPQVFPELAVKHVDPLSFSQNFTDLSLAEREQAYEFIRLANVILARYQCTAEMKKFSPDELPVLYTTNEEALFLRTAGEDEGREYILFHASSVPIKRHVKIKAEANPFDPGWEAYFESRIAKQMVDKGTRKKATTATLERTRWHLPGLQRKDHRLYRMAQPSYGLEIQRRSRHTRKSSPTTPELSSTSP
nr:hypothetical protein [Paenactinomyces guangxiensis]